MNKQQKNDEPDKIIITPEYPSFLVENFRTYLTYLSTNNIKLTKTKGYFSKKDLIALYSIMKGDNREVPQQSTQNGYPLLHLFYHLSLVLDFIRIRRYQSSVVADIQSEEIAAFMELTATEQYLTLLEAFWMETDWNELKDERWGRTPKNIDHLFDELEEIPANKEIQFTGFDGIYPFVFQYGHFFYYFSYFGFWNFVLDEEKSYHPKRPTYTIAKSITLTPFFKKIQHALYETWIPCEDEEDESFALFAKLFHLPTEIEMDNEESDIEETEEVESLVTLLRPLFPKEEVNITIIRTNPTFQEGTYLFKVKLSSSCWRILQFSSSHTLLDLHNLIQKAFEFDDDHLYAFYMDGKKFSRKRYNSPMDVHGPYVNEVKIGDFGLYEGQSFLYLFDFGDEWEFTVQLQKITEGEEVRKPMIIEKIGEAPNQYDW